MKKYFFVVVSLQVRHVQSFPPAAVRFATTDKHEALQAARSIDVTEHAHSISEIQIHCIKENHLLSFDEYLKVDDKDSVIVYTAKRKGPTPPRLHYWYQDFYGCFGRYTLEPIEEGQMSVTSGKFAVIVFVNREPFLVCDEVETLKQALSLQNVVKRLHGRIEIHDDKGKMSSL